MVCLMIQQSRLFETSPILINKSLNRSSLNDFDNKNKPGNKNKPITGKNKQE